MSHCLDHIDKKAHHVSPSKIPFNDILKLGGLSIRPIPALTCPGQVSHQMINVNRKDNTQAILPFQP